MEVHISEENYNISKIILEQTTIQILKVPTSVSVVGYPDALFECLIPT